MTRMRPSTISAVARPPPGASIQPTSPRAPACRTAASAQPAPRRAADVGGPATSTSSTSQRGEPLGDARRARDPHDPGAVAVDAGGDRRTLGAEAHRVLPGPDDPHRPAVLVGQPPGVGGHRRVDLAPERPAVGERAGRFAARLAPRGVGLQVGGLHPGGAQGQVPVTVGHGQRRHRSHGRAPALDLARRPPRLGQGLADGVPAPAVGDGHQRALRVVVVGEPAGAQCDLGPDLAGAPRPRWSARRPAASRSRVSSAARRSATAASWIVRQPVQRQRWAARARSTATSSPRSTPLRRAPSSRTMMPGVQKPHWLAPAAQKASAHVVGLGQALAGW